MRHNELRNRTRTRHGTTLLLVVIALIVITTILGAMFRSLAISNRQLKQRARQLQATMLAESAIERAVFALRNDAEYRQESWTIPSEEIGGRFDGSAKIEVVPHDKKETWVISVAATYPTTSDFRATVRNKLLISKNDGEDNGNKVREKVTGE